MQSSAGVAHKASRILTEEDTTQTRPVLLCAEGVWSAEPLREKLVMRYAT